MAGPFKLKSGNTTTFKQMGSSPIRQEKPSKETLLQDDPDWQDAASDLTAIKQDHLSTLNALRDQGLSDTNPDVKKVISNLHAIDRDLARHLRKIQVKDDIPQKD